MGRSASSHPGSITSQHWDISFWLPGNASPSMSFWLRQGYLQFYFLHNGEGFHMQRVRLTCAASLSRCGFQALGRSFGDLGFFPGGGHRESVHQQSRKTGDAPANQPKVAGVCRRRTVGTYSKNSLERALSCAWVWMLNLLRSLEARGGHRKSQISNLGDWVPTRNI